MPREEIVLLELTAEETLVLTLQGVLSKLTLLANVKTLSREEHELGARAAYELLKHLDAAQTLNDKVQKSATMMVMGDKYL